MNFGNTHVKLEKYNSEERENTFRSAQKRQKHQRKMGSVSEKQGSFNISGKKMTQISANAKTPI